MNFAMLECKGVLRPPKIITVSILKWFCNKAVMCPNDADATPKGEDLDWTAPVSADRLGAAQFKKVKVSHSLIAVGAVGVRVPLYLGHS